MSSIQLYHTIDLNNRGAYYIETCQFGRAIPVLCEALGLLKQVLSVSEENKSPQDPMNEDLGSLFTQFMSSTLAPRISPRLEENVGFIYKHPIHIPQGENLGGKAATSLSIMAMFNLALAHHLKALTSRKGSKTRLEKSIYLYELCHELVDREGIDSGVHFIMALVNNLGQIHTVLKDSTKALKYFERLLSIMLFLRECGCEAEDEGFLRNSTSALILENSFAAAAA
jgi:tetratricopeptide (TPR) repeat protein